MTKKDQRSKRGSEGAWVVERTLIQLLNEMMSGGEKRNGVFVIGATNRPDTNTMYPAITRPGRFGKHLYVPLLNSVQRGLIL